MKSCFKSLVFCFLLTKLQTERVLCNKSSPVSNHGFEYCLENKNKQIQTSEKQIQSKLVKRVNNAIQFIESNKKGFLQHNEKYYVIEIQDHLQPQLPQNYNKAPNIGFYPWAYPTPTKFNNNIEKNNTQQQTREVIEPIIKNQTKQIKQIEQITFEQPSKTTQSSIKTQQVKNQKQIQIQTKVSPILLPPISFPPPSLNFTIIPNLTQIIPTSSNLNSFSYTAPLNLSTTYSNQNSNVSVVQVSTGYLSSQTPNNLLPIPQTFVTTNSSLVNPSLYINSTAVPIQFNLSPSPQYTPPLLASPPFIRIGQKINLSGFLNATDLAILGCDQNGNC